MSDYTHDFKIECESHTIDGELRFDTDGQMEFKYDTPQSFTMEKNKAVTDLLESSHKLYEAMPCHHVKLIRIREKPVV